MAARQGWTRINCAIHKGTKELSLLTGGSLHVILSSFDVPTFPPMPGHLMRVCIYVLCIYPERQRLFEPGCASSIRLVLSVVLSMNCVLILNPGDDRVDIGTIRRCARTRIAPYFQHRHPDWPESP